MKQIDVRFVFNLDSLWRHYLKKGMKVIFFVCHELYEINIVVNFSWRSISAARWRCGLPRNRFQYFHRFLIWLRKLKKTRKNEKIPQLWKWAPKGVKKKTLPCFDIGIDRGSRATIIETIKWWWSASCWVMCENSVSSFEVTIVVSISTTISPCTWIQHAFVIELSTWLSFLLIFRKKSGSMGFVIKVSWLIRLNKKGKINC